MTNEKQIFMDWLTDNYQWIFSGIGIFVLGLIIAIFKTMKKKHRQPALTSRTKNQVRNEVNAKHINFNQTFVSDSKTGNETLIATDEISQNPELAKIKENYLGPKNKLRTFLIKKLAEARHDNPVLQVRHITDLGEDELGLSHENTLHELEKIEEEGLIKFDLNNNETISPYTPIKLTKKYFGIL